MERDVLLMAAAHLAQKALRSAVRGATDAPVRASLRRFREALAKADISVWPVTVRLDQPTTARGEPRIVSGHISVSREPSATPTHAFENSHSHKLQG